MKKLLLSLTSLAIVGSTSTIVLSCDTKGHYMIKIWHLDRTTGKPNIGNWKPLWEGDKRTIKRYAIDKSFVTGDAMIKMEIENKEEAVRLSPIGTVEQYTTYLTDLIGFPPEPWWGTS